MDEKKEFQVEEPVTEPAQETPAEGPVEEAPVEEPVEEAPVEEPSAEQKVEDVEQRDEDSEASEPVEETLAEQRDEVSEVSKASKKKKEKKKLTKEQKKKRTAKALIIVGSILLAIAIFISSCAIANAVGTKALIEQGSQVAKVEYTEHTQLIPTKDADGYYSFTKPDDGREFKIVQLTDVHIGGGCFSSQKDAWAMNAVATMVRAEQPDLVIVTGDIAYPVPFQAGTFNNLHATQIFSNMMEHLGVYWTFAFGNHDTEIYGTHDKQAIINYYENANFKYCLFNRGSLYDTKTEGGFDVNGCGNNIIKVKNPDGIITQAIVTLDSHSYFDGDYLGIQWKYDNLHQPQVDWYAQEMDKLVAQNVAKGGSNEPIKNMAFFHIPLVEYRDAWKQVIDKYGDVKNKSFEDGTVISDDVIYHYGVMGESDKERHGVRSYGVFCGYQQDEFFETGLTHGLQAVFCGHDHYNNFSVSYKGVRLTYGMSVDYLAYPGIFKVHAQRGCTVITLDKDGEFGATPKNYYKDYNVTPEKGEFTQAE